MINCLTLKSGLRGHTNKKQGGSSQKELPIQMDEIGMVRNENNQLKQSIGNAEEINKELPDYQENKHLEVEALKPSNYKCHSCNMCEKDFNSEKGLKGHNIFKHTTIA